MTIDIFIQSRMFSETKQVVFVPEPKTKVFNNINNNPKVIIYVNLTCLISFSMMLLPSYITAINVATMREIF